MKILPIDSKGEPVELTSVNTGQDSLNLLISCEGNLHRLTLSADKTLTIHDHPEKDIATHEDAALMGGTPGVACPCVRVKLWLQQGIYIMEIIP